MKLTEQQLAQMFQNSKNTDFDHSDLDLHASVDASEKRLTDVEKITNNSTLSASYQIINQLQDWSQAIGTDIELNIKPNFTAILSSWFKPSLATAAMVTALYFVTPNITAELDNRNTIQQKPDLMVFSANFEGKKDSDIIKSLSFEGKPSININVDSISKRNFS